MPDEDTETMNQYNDYSAEQLKAALQRLLLYSDLEDQDVEEMEKILAVLREKTPFEHPRTAEEMWAEIKAEHAEETASLGIHEKKDTEEVIEKEPVAAELRAESESTMPRPKSVRGVLRVAMIAAAMVVFIILATVTASAFGYDLWGWVPRWNDEVLSFGGEESESNEFYDSSPIVKALEELGIDEPIFPHWIPEGFESDYSVIKTDPVFLHESYSFGERYLSITVEPLAASGALVFQKDYDEPLEYNIGQRTHYITSDLSCHTATWHTDTVLVQITGNVSIEEMEQIINSIYEVDK